MSTKPDQAQNPFYVGKVRWAGVEYPGNHTPLVSAELFAEAQRVLHVRHEDHGEKGKLRFFLRGVARCAECKGFMTAERHERWIYYRCVRRTMDKNLCGSRMSNGRAAEDSINGVYRRLRLTAAFKTAVLSKATRLLNERHAVSQQRLRSQGRRRRALDEREIRIAESFSSGELSKDAYQAALRRLRAQVGVLEAECRAGKEDPRVVRERIESWMAFAESIHGLHVRLNQERRAFLLRLVFRCVYLEAGAIVAWELNPPFDRLLHDDAQDGTGSDLEDDVYRAAKCLIFDVPEPEELRHFVA